MTIRVFENDRLAAKAAATIFASEILKKPDCIIGLATGSTPVPTYQELIRLNQEGVLDFSKVRSFNLDEYVGLAPEHPCSYRRFMNEQLFDHINIDKANTHVPSGIGDDPEKNAAEYDAAIEAAGGVDLQLLGIGHNGHIGFNEPCDRFIAPTNIVTLTDSTINANTRFFEKREDVPRKAISMGSRTIMSARRILMIATGEGKAQAVRDMICGDIDPRHPASILQAHHNVQILLDKGAASLL